MILGMRSHYIRSNRVNQVFKLFIYYIFVLVLVLMFEFYKPAEELIPLLYLIYVMSGIGQVIQIDFFVKQCKQFHSNEIHKKLEAVSVILVMLHLCILLIAPTENIGAYCQDNIKYPVGFQMINFLQIGMFIMSYYFYCKNYWIDESQIKEDRIILIEEVDGKDTFGDKDKG